MSSLRMAMVWFLGVFGLTTPAHAVNTHDVGQSYVFLRIDNTSIHGRFEIPVGYLNQALSLSFRTDGGVMLADIDPHIDSITSYLRRHAEFTSAEGTSEITFGAYRLYQTSFAQFVVIDFSLPEFAAPPEYLDVRYTAVFDVDPQHRGLLVEEHNWKTGTFNEEANVALIFTPNDTEQRLDLSSSSIWRGFKSLVALGTHHIWIGIDHVLFLLALLLPAVLVRKDGRWQPVEGFRTALFNVITIVTLFTIAHSVTLSLAALDVIRLPSRLVESVIALSIAMAAANIVVPIFKAHVYWVVLGFGLFHGFGFATVLGEMGIPGRYMALSLLGFNVGVEIGQVAITALIFPLLFLMRRVRLYSSHLVHAGAVLLMLISLYWFTERAFEVDIPIRGAVTRVIGV